MQGLYLSLVEVHISPRMYMLNQYILKYSTNAVHVSFQFIHSKHTVRLCLQAAPCMFDLHALAVPAGTPMEQQLLLLCLSQWGSLRDSVTAATNLRTPLPATHHDSNNTATNSLIFLSDFHTSYLTHVREHTFTLPTMTAFCHWKQYLSDTQGPQ